MNDLRLRTSRPVRSARAVSPSTSAISQDPATGSRWPGGRLPRDILDVDRVEIHQAEIGRPSLIEARRISGRPG